MTTLFQDVVSCGVCGASAFVTVMASTNQNGSTDLDTRPPPMMRDTMQTWLQACPECGYVAPELPVAAEGMANLVWSNAYQALRAPGTPARARPFTSYAYLQENMGKLDQAAWATIHAAWVCDDIGEKDWADRLRLDAVALIDRAAAAGSPLTDDATANGGIRTDLLRRAGRFEDADACASATLAMSPPEIVRKVLEFQRQLIAKQDRSCRTVAQAIDAIR